MDQTCPVVHKSRRPQARLLDSHTVLHTLCLRLENFCNPDIGHIMLRDLLTQIAYKKPSLTWGLIIWTLLPQ
jgi:hypothetical protein